MDALKVLIVEDSPDDLELVLIALRNENFDVSFTHVMTADDLGIQLEKSQWDLVISDYDLPSFSGFEALRIVRQKDKDLPFILVSGKINDEFAVRSIKAGANDYVLKSNLTRLGPAVRRERMELVTKQKLENELRIKEEIVRRSQKLEAFGTLAGGIIHDFNNFLAVVMIAADMAEDGLEEGHPVLSKVRQISAASKRAKGLTRQLLTFCKRQRVEPQEVDLNALIQECMQLLRNLLSDGIRVELDLSPANPTIYIDPSQLEQVLMNFIMNSRDAMPNGGDLIIKTATQNGQVRVSVTDTGIGMDEDIQKRIFDPFYSTKGPDRGTGLGLSTALSIVKDCNGKIVVKSSQGMGATFTAIFSEFAGNRVSKNTLFKAYEDFKGTETVMLMEDDPSVREMMVQVLELHGYKVIIAKSSDHAVQLTREYPGDIHVFLSDLAQDSERRIEIGYKILELRKNARVLFITGFYDKEKFEYPEQPQFKNILQKPFSKMALLEKLRSTILT